MATPDLESLVEQCISKHGLHLIDLVIKNEGKGKSLEVYIDSEQGVTTKVCSEVSRDVASALQSAGVVQNRLMVSSPGIARPLKFPWQYKKHVGRDLMLKIRGGDGENDIVGSLESVDDNALVLKKNGEPRSIAFDVILDAQVKAPW